MSLTINEFEWTGLFFLKLLAEEALRRKREAD